MYNISVYGRTQNMACLLWWAKNELDGTMKEFVLNFLRLVSSVESVQLHIYADNVQWMKLTKQLVHHMYFKRYAASKVPAEYSCILQKCNGNNDKC